MNKDKINLLMLNYEFPPIGGGTGISHSQLLWEYTNNKNLRVDVLTSFAGKGIDVVRYADNVTVFRVGIHKKQLHYWRKAEIIEWLIKARIYYGRLLNTGNYDLIHAFTGFPSGWLSYRSRRRIPYIVSLRGSDVPGFNGRLGFSYKLLSRLFNNIWKSASRVVANSTGLRKLASNSSPCVDIDVIPNGVNTERFYPSKTPNKGSELKLLTVGRLIQRKRIDWIIRAIAAIHTNVSLYIVGDGPLKDDLQRLVKDLNIHNRVVFLDAVPSKTMPDVYRNAHIYVTTSEHEGMSNATLEAMASGLPIIATSCEGVDELVEGNGVIVASAEGITQAVTRIVKDNCLRMTMSARSVSQAKKYSCSKVADSYTAMYRSVLD